MDEPTKFAIAFVVIGLYAFLMGVRMYREHQFFAQTEAPPIGQLAEAGRVKLEGTVEAIDDARVNAPISNETGVLVGWLAEEYRTYGWRGGFWEPLAQGVDAVPFRVRDESGDSIRVEIPDTHETYGFWLGGLKSAIAGLIRTSNKAVSPAKYLVSFASGERGLGRMPIVASVETDGETPDEVAAFNDERGIGKMSSFARERQYSLQCLTPGDDVFLLGRAEHVDDPERERIPPGKACLRPLKDGRLVVAIERGTEFKEYRRRAALAHTALGAVFMVFGTGLWLLF